MSVWWLVCDVFFRLPALGRCKGGNVSVEWTSYSHLVESFIWLVQ